MLGVSIVLAKLQAVTSPLFGKNTRISPSKGMTGLQRWL